MEPKFKIGDKVIIGYGIYKHYVGSINQIRKEPITNIVHYLINFEKIEDYSWIKEELIKLYKRDIKDTHPELLVNMDKLGQSIEDAADEYDYDYINFLNDGVAEVKLAMMNAFIAGAKSQAAREHWFNEFSKK